MQPERSCPQCGVSIVKDDRYPAWCPSCEWNLTSRDDRRRTLGEVLAARLTAGLHAQVLARGGELSGGGATRVLSSALAALVHLLTLASAAAGVWIAITVPNLVGFALCGLLLGVAWMMRPRLGRIPRDAPVLTRESAPHLFDLLDRVGAEVGADRVDAFLLTEEYNASFGRVGLRGTRLLCFGAPLWAMLEPQERVAVLAHELSHSSNGDARHARLVGTAIGALAAVRRATRTTAETGEDATEVAAQTFAGLVLVVLVFAMRLAGLVIGLVGLLLLATTTRSSRRAEYVADRRAARVASSAVAAAALDKLATAAVDVRQLAWLAASFGDSVWQRLADRQAQVPEHELERRRRLVARLPRYLDDSHPPLDLRIAYVRSLPAATPAVRLGEGADAAIRAELAPHFSEIATTLGEARREVSFA